MKYRAPLFLITVLILVAATSSAICQNSPIRRSSQETARREILTNESIINLARAKFKERTIVTLIRTSETAFDISTPGLVELKKRGVSERVISEMIERTNAGESMRRLSTLRDDEFFSKADEAFFGNSPVFRELPSEKEARKKEEEAMIFGSKSGSRGESQTRGNILGPNGSRSQESDVAGSATVRIIRPQTEGGATPKLERAPKLDNQGVLEMIQAGFSEGTIIRKIESSQVEFDLSTKALTNLRQNRVSEKIIKAMTSAMDESK